MPDSLITCPNCQTQIPLTSAIEGPIVERLRKQFELDTLKAAAEAKKKAEAQLAVELTDLKSQLSSQDAKLKDAQATEVALRQQRRELEQQKEALGLEVSRRVDEETAKLKVELQKSAREEFARKEAQKDQQLADLRKQIEEAAKRTEALAAQEKTLATKMASLEDARRQMEDQVAQQLKKEREKIAAEALSAARKEQAASFTDLQQQLTEKEQKLQLAQKLELDLRKQQRELEEKKQAFELDAARTLDAEREQIKLAALKAADEAHRLKEAEKDKQLTDMRQQIDDLKRKAEQGSQQLQGEVLELELERLLRIHFPHDQITPVAKGIHGGDVLHRVCTPAAQACGTILWESKRTKTWSDGWIEKLKEDQRAAKADIAVIVTTTLPKDVTTMAYIDGVWVTSRDCMMGLVAALRAGLVRLAEVHRAAEGKHEKMEVLYRYLSGHEFQQRVEAIVDAFVTLREDLEAEKRFITKNWAKREKQIDRVMASTTGMYGDLSGIIGGALPKIATIDLPALPSADDETDTPN